MLTNKKPIVFFSNLHRNSAEIKSSECERLKDTSMFVIAWIFLGFTKKLITSKECKYLLSVFERSLMDTYI